MSIMLLLGFFFLTAEQCDLDICQEFNGISVIIQLAFLPLFFRNKRCLFALLCYSSSELNFRNPLGLFVQT